MSCCVEQTNGAPPGGGGSPEDVVAEGSILDEIDFRSTPTVPLVNGATTIDGHAFTVANAAAAATFERNSLGVRIVQLAATATVMTSAAQSAPYLYTTLSQVRNWSQGLDVLFKVFVSAYTAGPASVSDQCRVGLWRLAGDPLSTNGVSIMGAGFRRSATVGNVKCIYNLSQASAGSAEDVNLVGFFNSFSFKVAAINGDFSSGVGNYTAGAWAQFDMAQIRQVTTAIQFDTANTRLYIAAPFASSGAPTMDWTIERIQVIRT